MSSSSHKLLGVTLITALSFTATIHRAIAQSGVGTGTVESRLALKSLNPIADLITVPIEYDFEFGSGVSDARTWTLLLHPVIPFELANDWRLVTRTIVPVIRQEAVTSTDENESGLGDITQSLFLSPPNLATWSRSFPTHGRTTSRLGLTASPRMTGKNSNGRCH